jgi:hypothetical protein
MAGLYLAGGKRAQLEPARPFPGNQWPGSGTPSCAKTSLLITSTRPIAVSPVAAVAALLGPGVQRRASRSRAARSLPQPLPGSQEQCCTASGVGGGGGGDLPAAWREAGCLVALHERRPGLTTPESRPSHGLGLG